MSKREKIISVCALVLLAIAALSLTLVLVFKKETRVKEIYGYFDTVTVLRDFSGASEGEFAERCRCVSDIFESYHRLSDIYNEYEGINNLKTLNDNAGRGAVKIAPELMELLIFAKDIHALTDGEVNVAMGGVLAEWHGWREGMSNGYSPALPSQELLDGLFAHSDIDSLLLDLENMTAELADSEMSLDLGALAKGFATEMKACMTKGEVENLVNSCKILTFECGVRFLEDHLKGDTYFKIHREGHNLDRARTQFKLVADMEKKTAEMNAVVAKYFN